MRRDKETTLDQNLIMFPASKNFPYDEKDANEAIPTKEPQKRSERAEDMTEREEKPLDLGLPPIQRNKDNQDSDMDSRDQERLIKQHLKVIEMFQKRIKYYLDEIDLFS